VIAVDPSGGTKDSNAECGIIAAAKDRHGHAYVLADVSARLSPERWAARAVALYEQFRADRIICEQNFGGQMVESTIRTVNRHVAVKMIQASRGKQQRAEPVVALYEQRLVHHVVTFPQLEDQMTGWVPGQPGPSPDRLDALVWALSELCVDEKSLDLQVWLKLTENPASPTWWQQQYRGNF
jgi:phage terminase large subunit-like protein